MNIFNTADFVKPYLRKAALIFLVMFFSETELANKNTHIVSFIILHVERILVSFSFSSRRAGTFKKSFYLDPKMDRALRFGKV